MTPENKKALLPCPFCGARDIFVREKPNNSDAECHQCGCVAGLTGWNARADLSAQAAADDEVLMPKKLTAENGSKYAMIGEFYERIEDADGNVTRVALSWKNIKAIYDKAVELHGRAATRAPDAGLVEELKKSEQQTFEIAARLLKERDALVKALEDAEIIIPLLIGDLVYMAGRMNESARFKEMTGAAQGVLDRIEQALADHKAAARTGGGKK